MFMSRPALSPSQLKRLSEHKYSSQCSSILDPFMQVFWNWLVTKLPLWIAPNAITIIGLIINVVTSVILMIFCPDARSPAPAWACALAAVGLFIYQSLDAVDGKQARRTKSSSPLGELFDHGCDAMSTVFVIISLSIVMECGYYPSWMFLQCFAAFFIYYVAHWQTYVSGTLRFGKFDVTEAQFSVIFIQLMSAIFGSSFWAHKVPVLGWELKLVVIGTSIIPVSYGILCNLHVVLTGGVGKNGSTVAGSSVLSPCLPICLVLIPAYVIAQKSTISIFGTHPCLYTLTFGLVSAKVSSRLVVAHMTKSEMDCLDSVLIGPGLLFLNQYFDTAVNEYIILCIALVYTILDFSIYCGKVCTEICTYLNIYLFKITVPKDGKSGASYNLRSHIAEYKMDEVQEGGSTDLLLDEVVIDADDESKLIPPKSTEST